MPSLLDSPAIQYGALGLCFVVVLAFVRAFFMMLSQRHEMQHQLFVHHGERERAFAEQFVACIDRNSAALEKVEQSLERIHVQLARNENRPPDAIYLEPL